MHIDSIFPSWPWIAGSFFKSISAPSSFPPPVRLDYSIQPYLKAYHEHHRTSSVQSRVKQAQSLFTDSTLIGSMQKFRKSLLWKKKIMMLLMELSSSFLKLIKGIPHLCFTLLCYTGVSFFYNLKAKALQQKRLWLTLLQYLHRDGLELNLQYLQLMPIITFLNAAYSSIFTPLPYHSLKLLRDNKKLLWMQMITLFQGTKVVKLLPKSSFI